MIRLHGYFRSSSSYRCRIAFNLKRGETRFMPVHLRRGGGEQKGEGYRNLTPQMRVPAIKADGHVLTQSPAILEWIEENWPEPPLLPADLFERAAVRAFCAAIACEIHPLQNLRVLAFLRSEMGQNQEAIDRWLHRWIAEGLNACEALLDRRPPSRFAFGDAPGMAEIYLVPQIFSANRFGVDLAAMPRLRAIHSECEALAAFVDAHPSRQPDAE